MRAACEGLVYAVAKLVARYPDGQLKTWGRDRGRPWSRETAASVRAKLLLPYLEALDPEEVTRLLFHELALLGLRCGERHAAVRAYAEDRELLAPAEAEEGATVST